MYKRQVLAFTGVNLAAGIDSTGNAGVATLSIDNNLSIANGGQISSSTFSSGNGGSILIQTNELDINADGAQLITGVTSLSTQSGVAGDIGIAVDGNVGLSQGAAITTSSTGAGESGTIMLDAAGQVIVEDMSTISANAAQTPAGSVTVVTDTLVLSNSEISTTTTDAVANGGNISIDSEAIILDSGLIQANAVSGTGGEILILGDAVIPARDDLQINPLERQVFQLDGPSTIQSVAPTGTTLTPEISAPEVDISALITELESNFVEQTELASDPCSALREGTSSSLVVPGKGGLPVYPNENVLLNLKVIQLTDITFDGKTDNNTKPLPGQSISTKSVCAE